MKNVLGFLIVIALVGVNVFLISSLYEKVSNRSMAYNQSQPMYPAAANGGTVPSNQVSKPAAANPPAETTSVKKDETPVKASAPTVQAKEPSNKGEHGVLEDLLLANQIIELMDGHKDANGKEVLGLKRIILAANMPFDMKSEVLEAYSRDIKSVEDFIKKSKFQTQQGIYFGEESEVFLSDMKALVKNMDKKNAESAQRSLDFMKNNKSKMVTSSLRYLAEMHTEKGEILWNVKRFGPDFYTQVNYQLNIAMFAMEYEFNSNVKYPFAYYPGYKEEEIKRSMKKEAERYYSGREDFTNKKNNWESLFDEMKPIMKKAITEKSNEARKEAIAKFNAASVELAYLDHEYIPIFVENYKKLIQ
jgi:hypothetical protein